MKLFCATCEGELEWHHKIVSLKGNPVSLTRFMRRVRKSKLFSVDDFIGIDAVPALRKFGYDVIGMVKPCAHCLSDRTLADPFSGNEDRKSHGSEKLLAALG